MAGVPYTQFKKGDTPVLKRWLTINDKVLDASYSS
jgi:hypothetical protein